MKETLPLFLLFYSLLWGSCDDQLCLREVTYVRAMPVFASLEELRRDLSNTRIAEILNPGKMIRRNRLLFVADIDRGIHIFNPGKNSSREHINFISIPGIRDFLIDEYTLVANSYYDILTIDIQNPETAQLIQREKSAFPIPFYNDRGQPVVGFQLSEYTEKVHCDSPLYDGEIYFFDALGNMIAPTTIPSFLIHRQVHSLNNQTDSL